MIAFTQTYVFSLCICSCHSSSLISLHAFVALSFSVCASVVNMVRVSKLKGKHTKSAASADDIAKTLVTRAAAWAVVASHAYDAAFAMYQMESSLSNASSFNLERFIASAKSCGCSTGSIHCSSKGISKCNGKTRRNFN